MTIEVLQTIGSGLLAIMVILWNCDFPRKNSNEKSKEAR